MHPWQTDPALWQALGPLVRAKLPADIIGEPQFLGAGDFSVAFAVGDYVARVPRHDDAAASQAREACLLPLLAPLLPLEIPQPTIIEASPDLPAFSLHRRIPGQPLERDTWLSLPRARQTALAHGVGYFLKALHTIPPETVGACNVPISDPRANAIPVRADAAVTIYPLLSAETAAAADRLIDRYINGGSEWDYRPSILHCDFGPQHTFYDPDRIELTGVIDFSDVVIGDPARDFIFILEDWNADFLELTLQAYDLEPRESLMPRIHFTSFINAVWWTLWVKGKGQEDLFHIGLAIGLAQIPQLVEEAENGN